MAIRFHQCVHCLGLVELFGDVIPCVHRPELDLDKQPRGSVECDCPVEYVYIAPDECSRASCDGHWSISDDPYYFEMRVKAVKSLYGDGC